MDNSTVDRTTGSPLHFQRGDPAGVPPCREPSERFILINAGGDNCVDTTEDSSNADDAA